MYSLEVVSCEEDVKEEKCEENTQGTTEEEEVMPRISLNAMTEVTSYQTIRVKGHVKKQVLHLLVDCGSTHKFLDLHAARRLGWTIQGQVFETDVMILPLEGCEMVLGIQWLATLGTIQFDFKNLVMDFVLKGKRCVLRGTPQSTLQWIKGKQLGSSLNQMRVEIFSMAMCVCLVTLMQMTGVNAQCEPNIQTLLKEFNSVFATPKELPPNRSHDHTIPLSPNTPPINIRPYKHPPNQKDAIEIMVKELLEAGIIRNNQSSFSSPIVKALMNTVFKPYLRKFVLVFFDDILVYNKSEEKHWDHLRIVLQVMQQHTLFAKGSKCTFAAKQVDYLGHIINVEGVSTDPTKIQAIENWPIPHTGTENIVADALSRINSGSELNAMVLSTVTSELLQKIQSSYDQDISLQKIIEQLTQGVFANNKYQWEGGVLKRKGKLVVSPYKVVYGQTPPLHNPYVAGESAVESVDRSLHARENAIEMLKFHIKRSHDKIKKYVDLKRSKREFEPLLILLPSKQFTGKSYFSFLQNNSPENHKTLQGTKSLTVVDWYAEFGDPDRDPERSGTGGQVHPVFHVSQLKLRRGNSFKRGPLPHCGDDGLLSVEPKKILDRRIGKLNNTATVHVLVKWVNHNEEDATWELAEDLLRRFPDFSFEEEWIFTKWKSEVKIRKGICTPTDSVTRTFILPDSLFKFDETRGGCTWRVWGAGALHDSPNKIDL
ncbi:reverse transcriptase [Tanacetum coccineum]